jgi:long-chain acyl-CoA synthetase
MERIWLDAYDATVPKTIAYEDKTVVDYFEEAAAAFPRHPALTLKGRTLTYSQLRELVDRCATALASLGVVKGSRVAVWMPNLPQYLIGYYAALKLGAVVVNTNPLYVQREIEHQFNDAKVSVVICCDFLWWYKLRAIRERIPTIEHVVVASIPDFLPFPLNLLAPLKLKKTQQYVKVPREAGVHRFKELVSSHSASPPATPLSGEDWAVFQYTGGTTGVSKGAVLTHRNISANVQQIADWFPAFGVGTDVLHAIFPYFHVAGMTVCMNLPLRKAAHIILAPNPRDIADVIKSIMRYRVTIFPALPAIFHAISNYPGIEKLDLSSIKSSFSGSAPLPIEVLERFERLTGSVIIEAYGLSETSPLTHCNPCEGTRKVGSVGVPVPDTDVKIVDTDTGETELGVGQEGEVCIKGPQVMHGYLDRPDETATALRDGWLHTGDLATMDADGYFTIVGRKKDMIIASGYNIYPDEIDDVLFAHPAVLEAATIGVPDEKRGETVKSFLVLRPEHDASREEIVAYCREKLAAYKVPKQIEFVPELPKSSMLKILRRELRERELAKRGEAS